MVRVGVLRVTEGGVATGSPPSSYPHNRVGTTAESGKPSASIVSLRLSLFASLSLFLRLFYSGSIPFRSMDDVAGGSIKPDSVRRGAP